MPQSVDQPADGDPTPAEIFRVFRNTTTASLEGLRLLLEECADLRAELVTIHGLQNDDNEHGQFSTRQQDRILELQEAADEMKMLLASLPPEEEDSADRRGEP